jgi:phytanoyl-CoA hydroxylase
MRRISDDEIGFFDKNGYVICRGVLAEDELATFRSESGRLIGEILAGGPAGERCNRGPEGVPYYLTYLHATPNDFSLRLLAHPFIGDLLTRMVGPDFIPCYEALVFKLPEGGSSVPWHRDGNALTGEERIFNIDLYPDRSTVENSCVWVIPGSHRWEHRRAQEMVLRGRTEFFLPGAVPAELDPGDVLLHHVKVLHGSQQNRSGDLRRVVYFDNRAASWNDRYGWFDRSVIEKRCRLYQYAVHERLTHPYASDDEVFDYAPPPGLPHWHLGDPIDLHAPRVAPGEDV